MKVSLICTVWNEEETIKRLLDSIKAQTMQPDEFIISDGGSADGTVKILKEYKKHYKTLRIIEAEKCNIAEGRNIAIKAAKNDIIIGCDGGGCFYHKDWIKNMVKGFNGQIGFGRTLPFARNRFERIMGESLTKGGNYGSSRNIVFSKKIWKEVGGYPEDFYGGEDTLFNERIFNKGYKASKIPDAFGYRAMRSTYKGLYNQFKNFGHWDGVNYKYYGKVPKKYLLAVVLSYFAMPIGIILSPFLLFSTWLRIFYMKRLGYFVGFHRGLFFGKIEKSAISGRKEKEIEKHE